jgi:hypothetical protein
MAEILELRKVDEECQKLRIKDEIFQLERH